jgi:hypothetical protein
MELSTEKLQFWEWKKHPIGPGTFCPAWYHGILHSSIAGMSSGLRSGTFSADTGRFRKSLNIKKYKKQLVLSQYRKVRKSSYWHLSVLARRRIG